MYFPPSFLLAATPSRLISLNPVDITIIAMYFVVVLAIGFYLKGQARTGEDFFMAGREMTAWIAGLSFLSANLGSLELMGWAAASYQYGILATHWYWIGAIPAMLFLGLVMMPIPVRRQNAVLIRGTGIGSAPFRRRTGIGSAPFRRCCSWAW